jgi:hypothetical protein
MAESFLEEQLKRIRAMTEQMSRATHRAAELNDELARTREASRQGPLNDVRDFRHYSSTNSASIANDSKEQSHADAGSARRHTARESSRRRR